MEEYILTLDQGTSSSRALLVDKEGQSIGIAQREFTQFYPNPGWVEHDPMEILNSQLAVIKEVLHQNSISINQIAGVTITNQRETVVFWETQTGKPVYPAIVWQDQRTAAWCQKLKETDLAVKVKEKTGLVLDSYFSASKMKWVLDEVPDAQLLLKKQGRIKCGTIDSWLIYNLSDKLHYTDSTNASRTMLWNIHSKEWDHDLCSEFDIPKEILPEVKDSMDHICELNILDRRIPLVAVAGDQQAALFGQLCFNDGDVKNTYGTGCFTLMNVGDKPIRSKGKLLSTVAWSRNGTFKYAIEGSVFIAGAAIQWLRDGLRIIDHSNESELHANNTDADEVVVVPAFAGFGAPYWDMKAKGAIFGLTRDSGKSEIIKATLQSLAFQTKDLIDAMQEEGGMTINKLRVDGGASSNNWLMQFQADMLNSIVERPINVESTAMGVSLMGGIVLKWWTEESLLMQESKTQVFEPKMNQLTRERLFKNWQKAVQRTLNWDE